MTSADHPWGEGARGDRDEDVWAAAVAEDAAEQERRRRAEEQRRRPDGASGGPDGQRAAGERPGPGGRSDRPAQGPLVEEVRRFAAAVGEKVQQASQLVGPAGEGLQQLAAPLRERHPEVYRHLAAAGGELMAAYRAAVSGHERRWTAGERAGSEHIDLD